MPFLEYRDNDSGLRPSSYPYMLGRALIQDIIDTSVTIYTLVHEERTTIKTIYWITVTFIIVLRSNSYIK